MTCINYSTADCYFSFSLQEYFFDLMLGSSHIQSVLIGIKYQNCCGTFDVCLLVANSIGQIQSNKFVIYRPSNPLVTSPLNNID